MKNILMENLNIDEGNDEEEKQKAVERAKHRKAQLLTLAPRWQRDTASAQAMIPNLKRSNRMSTLTFLFFRSEIMRTAAGGKQATRTD